MGSNYLQEIKILIVEDSTEERKKLLETLQRYFKTIYEAEDGEKAYEIYSQNDKNIDLIISKITLRNLDGIELLRKIRESNFNLPFIFISDKTDSKTILDAVDLNISYYMFKPINIHNLLQKIDFVCEKLFLQKKLNNKQKELQNYIDSVDNVSLIFKMNENGQITYMNKTMQEVSGYSKEELERLNFKDLIHPNVSKVVIEDTWEKLKNGELYQGDTKFLSKKDEEFYLNSTIFKTNSLEDEYITVAFLTTQENLKKRDFYKKVLHNIQESNKKENEYKKLIYELSYKLQNQESYLENANHLIETEKKRALSKERQLNHYELQMENLNTKHEKIIYAKNEEIKTYADSVEEKKKKIDIQTRQLKYLESELKILREKYANLEKELDYKNHRITGLLDLLNNKNKELQKQAV